jgi:hypothetical protein
VLASGAPFETSLIFRVAAPSSAAAERGGAFWEEVVARRPAAAGNSRSASGGFPPPADSIQLNYGLKQGFSLALHGLVQSSRNVPFDFQPALGNQWFVQHRIGTGQVNITSTFANFAEHFLIRRSEGEELPHVRGSGGRTG